MEAKEAQVYRYPQEAVFHDKHIAGYLALFLPSLSDVKSFATSNKITSTNKFRLSIQLKPVFENNFNGILSFFKLEKIFVDELCSKYQCILSGSRILEAQSSLCR